MDRTGGTGPKRAKLRAALMAAALAAPAAVPAQQMLSSPLLSNPLAMQNAATTAALANAASQNPQADQMGRQSAQTQLSTGMSDTFSPDQIRNDPLAPSLSDGGARNYPVNRPQRTSPPSEFEALVSSISDKPLRRFGSELLLPDARDFTTPPTTQVPPDYRLNPGDEISVGLTGSVQSTNLLLRINPDGKTFVPKVGEVNLAGVRYGDLQAVLARALSRQYRNFEVSVTVGRLHGITVYVTGYALTPGSYTVSSLSTLVNAVLAAGGPASGGSFRSIQLNRGGRVIADFDFYDLLLKGDKRRDPLLQEGDVIFIAPAGAQAAVIGSVNNEAIFEARPNETVRDLMVYAGGVNTVADDARALILDPKVSTGTGWQEISPDEARTRIVRRGEVIRVLSETGIAKPLQSLPVLVTVSGEVAKPGHYYVPAGTRLDDVLQRAGGLTADAYPFGAVLTRQSVRDQQRISYARAMDDLSFQLKASPLVRSTRDNPFPPERTNAIQDLLTELRARQPDGRVLLDIQPAATSLPGDIRLEPNDTIYVPPRPLTVGVFGAVPSSGSFQYTGRETIGQVLARAGGLQRFGDKSEIFVVRANGSLITKKRGALNQLALPGDLIFVPIDAERGQTWDKIRDLSGLLLSGIVSAATVVAVTQ